MSLCDGCRSGMWYERAQGEREYFCRAVAHTAQRIPGDIVRCSRFEARTETELWEMKEIAWRLERRVNGQVKGFQAPKEQE